MKDIEIAETCERAAAIVEGRWTQGEYYADMEEGEPIEWRVCAVGALAVAHFGLEAIAGTPNFPNSQLTLPLPIYTAVERVLGHEIEAWNDAPGRNRREVASLLRAVAHCLREGAAAPLASKETTVPNSVAPSTPWPEETRATA